MKIKRIIALFLCAVMFVALFSACDSDTGMSGLGGIFVVEEEVSPYPLDTKVAFIYFNEVGGNPLIDIFEYARGNLERTLGAETAYMENVKVIQFAEAVEIMIENGADIIVAASNSYNSAVILAADKYADVLFISFGGADQRPNLASVQPMLYQAANICGFAAAFNTDSNHVGIVADTNMFNAYGVVNAFALGVRELPNSRVDVSVNWALSAHHNETRAAILDLIEQGADIIFVYQSDDYGIKLIEEIGAERGVRVMGFAYNLPEIAPTQFMMGMSLNLNTYPVDKVRLYMYGNKPAFGDLTRRGLFHKMVFVVGDDGSNLKPGTREIVLGLHEMIVDGRAPVFGGEIRDMNDGIRVSRGTTLYISQIFAIRWLTNIIGVEKNFSEPLTELILSDFTIKS